MKKKIAALGIAICLAAALCACGGTTNNNETGSTAASTKETAGSSIVGIFKLVKMEGSDITLSEDDIALAESMGAVFYLDFSDDGTVKADLYGEESTGTWNKSSITLDEATMKYSLDGDTLTLTEDDVTAILMRTTQDDIDGILANAESTETAAEEEEAASDGYHVEGTYSTDETVLVDTDDCAMTITGYDTDDPFYGLIVNIRCDNKTSDKTLNFRIEDAAVNGYMMTSIFPESVSAGNSANATLDLVGSELETAGITSVDELELKIRVYDDEDWSDVYEGTVTVYPTGKTADEIVSPERTSTDNESVAADDENVTFVTLGLERDEDTGTCYLRIYMENKTDKTLTFDLENVAVNGKMIDPYWAENVLPGKKAYSTASFYESDLEDNGITDISQITSIEYKLQVQDADDWSADYLVDETFTYNP